ncbi:outer membrane protein OmpW [Rosenbergiella australiborealis]|uniref:Outer membrane protein OmpW n=1 Tax=Rosenbergiella australiborealis TaxID=1544696 RepID=A0ABS5T209_9GAMM|nr:outer membrane protein OmpW [Rosenbergiella australiborealis]MBT0726341.1 outer membrane protein OmpW [Rosenbergiella australiborealis]
MKLRNIVLSLALICPAVASAHQAGDFFIRGGAALVRPTGNSDNVLGLGSFNVSNNTQLGLTFTYMATDHIGVELLAATPFRHKVGLRSTGTIATVHQLPPTLMAQYYFLDNSSKLQPYVGAGLNYTTFFDNKFTHTGREAGLSNLRVKDSWGYAAQAGMDYQLTDNWMLNASVWYMDIKTKVRFNTGSDTHSIDTKVNPVVFFLGAGYRF